ncbi:MAG: helical backbone metal receptor [Thermoprotei archaeon]
MRKVFCELTSKHIELPEKVGRVVSLSPALTEAIFEMGLGHTLVGRSAFDVHPEEAAKRPVLGSYSRTNVDKLKSLEPELVLLTTGYQRDLALTLSKQFPVYVLELPVTVASVIDQCAKVGLVMGYPEKARSIARNLYRALANQVYTGEDVVKAYVEIDLGGPVVFGANSYITDALNLVGASNIFGEDPCEWEYSVAERVIAADPDIIFYEPKMFRRTTAEHVIQEFARRGLSELRAIREGRVYLTPGPYDFLAHHGPSFITRALPWLNEKLHQASP